jgi:hypothetical protein
VRVACCSPVASHRGNQRQSEAIRCNLVRLPTEGEGRLLLAGGFPQRQSEAIRGNQRQSDAISYVFPQRVRVACCSPVASHVPRVPSSEGVVPGTYLREGGHQASLRSRRERASIGRRGGGGAPCRARTRARGQRGKGARGRPIATGPCRGAADLWGEERAPW